MQNAVANVARYSYNGTYQYLVYESAATNYIRNPLLVGAASGTPGTMPTYWNAPSLTGTGLTQQIVGVGVESGIPYIDIRFYGNTTNAVNLTIVDETGTSSIPALNGQSFTISSYNKLSSGTLNNASNWYCGGHEYNSGGNFLTTFSNSIPSPNSTALVGQRISTTYTCNMQATTNLGVWFGCAIANNVHVDFTLRTGAHQIENGSYATSLILPAAGTTGSTSRAADQLLTGRATDNFYQSRQIWLDPSYSNLNLAFSGYATPWQLSDTALTVPIRDATYWLERPVNVSHYGGTGGNDGVAAMAGIAKPMLRGVCYNISPTLIDATNRYYQYNNAPGTIQALYEGGAQTITFQADVADLTVGSTSPGYYRTCNAMGMFQLGSVPVHQITIDATGAFTSAGAQTNIANIARYIMTEDMLVPTASINLTSFSNADTIYHEHRNETG